MTASTLEQVIRHAGEDWLIDSYAPAEKAIPFLREKLAKVSELAQKRLRGNAPDLSESALIDLYDQQPLKIKGFLQVLGGTRTEEMLLMAWRILQGMEIKDVSMSYHRQNSFELHVTLESPYGEDDEVYKSKTIQDFVLFRHIGIMQVNGQPVFEGFYALNLA